MAISSTSFKIGNKASLGRRNAAKEYRSTFTRDVFEEYKGDIRKILQTIIKVAGDTTNKEWLEAAKLLVKHFITTPPQELHVSEENQSEDSNIIVSEFLKHNFTEQEIALFKEKIQSSYQTAIDEIVKNRPPAEAQEVKDATQSSAQ